MNTIGTSTRSDVWRTKYFKSTLEVALRNGLVCEKICKVDRSNEKYLANPYLTQPTAAVAAIAGTYAVTAFTTTDEAITVTDQVTYGVHIYEFEETLSRVNLYMSLVDDIVAAVKTKIDYFVLNKITDGAGESYDTPAAGFTTPANINKIIADLTGKMAGYAEDYNGMFLVIENTDLTGFTQAGMSNGFNFADSSLNNGFGGIYGGVEIYVVRAGTFATATIGTLTATNSGHRLFGIKNTAVYCTPRSVQMDEKKVTLKTGREVSVWANIGAGVWTPKANLLVDITIT